MIFSDLDVDVGKDDFTTHDWLGRKDEANKLSELVEQFTNPIVIALDGGWGSGKSHFLKLWVAEHKNWMKQNNIESATKVIYFDAFKYDYLDDPLASLVIRLEEEIGTTKVNKLKKFVSKLILKLPKFIAKIIDAYATVGSLSILIESLEDLQESSWSSEKGRIKAMEDFRAALKSLAGQNRLVFIIDELDRSRPDYALKVLEIIKHVFNVQNVHFVLGANFAALESSVASTYGEGVGARKYLGKFVNIFMRFIPQNFNDVPPTPKYFAYLAEHMADIGKAIDHEIVLITMEFLKHANIFEQLSLRDINYLFSRLSLFPNHTSRWSNLSKRLLVFVAILEAIDRKFIIDLIDGGLDSERLRQILAIPKMHSGKAEPQNNDLYKLCLYLNHTGESTPKPPIDLTIWHPNGAANNKEKHQIFKDQIFQCFNNFEMEPTSNPRPS